MSTSRAQPPKLREPADESAALQALIDISDLCSFGLRETHSEPQNAFRYCGEGHTGQSLEGMAAAAPPANAAAGNVHLDGDVLRRWPGEAHKVSMAA